MLKVTFILLHIIGFGVEKMLGLPTILTPEKSACYTFVLGQEVTSKEEEKAVWENEITGRELVKCMLTQYGVIGSKGFNIKNISKIQTAISKCPASANIQVEQMLEECTRFGVEVVTTANEETTNEIVQCIYYAVQKVYYNFLYK